MSAAPFAAPLQASLEADIAVALARASGGSSGDFSTGSLADLASGFLSPLAQQAAVVSQRDAGVLAQDAKFADFVNRVPRALRAVAGVELSPYAVPASHFYISLAAIATSKLAREHETASAERADALVQAMAECNHLGKKRIRHERDQALAVVASILGLPSVTAAATHSPAPRTAAVPAAALRTAVAPLMPSATAELDELAATADRQFAAAVRSLAQERPRQVQKIVSRYLLHCLRQLPQARLWVPPDPDPDGAEPEPLPLPDVADTSAAGGGSVGPERARQLLYYIECAAADGNEQVAALDVVRKLNKVAGNHSLGAKLSTLQHALRILHGYSLHNLESAAAVTGSNASAASAAVPFLPPLSGNHGSLRQRFMARAAGSAAIGARYGRSSGAGRIPLQPPAATAAPSASTPLRQAAAVSTQFSLNSGADADVASSGGDSLLQLRTSTHTMSLEPHGSPSGAGSPSGSSFGGSSRMLLYEHQLRRVSGTGGSLSAVGESGRLMSGGSSIFSGDVGAAVATGAPAADDARSMSASSAAAASSIADSAAVGGGIGGAARAELPPLDLCSAMVKAAVADFNASSVLFARGVLRKYPWLTAVNARAASSPRSLSSPAGTAVSASSAASPLQVDRGVARVSAATAIPQGEGGGGDPAGAAPPPGVTIDCSRLVLTVVREALHNAMYPTLMAAFMQVGWTLRHCR
jgi:hypothetical protein